MGRGNWRPSRSWPASDFLHFDIPMRAYDAHLKEFGDEGWKKNQFKLEETTWDYFNHFMEQIPTVLPPSFYPDDKRHLGEHVLFANSLCYVTFKEEDTYYAVAVVARDDLNEYGDTTLAPLAIAYVERHGKRILDKLARLYPGSATYPDGPWTSRRYTPPEEPHEPKRHRKGHHKQSERASSGL